MGPSGRYPNRPRGGGAFKEERVVQDVVSSQFFDLRIGGEKGKRKETREERSGRKRECFSLSITYLLRTLIEVLTRCAFKF